MSIDHLSFDLFKSLKILPTRHLYYFNVLKHFFKNNPIASNVSTENYSLRSAQNVYVPFYRTTSYRNWYTIVSRRLFNKLPNHIKQIVNLNPFLKKVKSWLLNFDHQEIETLLNPLL